MPYVGDKPAFVSINGHRLVILSRARETVEAGLDVLGADCIKEVVSSGSRRDEAKVLNKLARSVDSGVVVAPEEFELPEVIRNLEMQLPWIQ